MYRLEVPGRMPTLNNIYSSPHWTKRKKMADEWHETIGWCLKSSNLPDEITDPFWLNATVFTKKMRDHDNCVIAAKFFLDALVKCGYVPDDSPKYVKGIVLQWQKAEGEEKTVYLLQ